MRIVVDYDTVIASNEDMWSEVLATMMSYLEDSELAESGITVTHSKKTAKACNKFLDNCYDGFDTLHIKTGEQAQDAVGADVWVTGRVDRVIGKEQVNTMHTLLNCS